MVWYYFHLRINPVGAAGVCLCSLLVITIHLLIDCFGLFVEFIDSKKTFEYHQINLKFNFVSKSIHFTEISRLAHSGKVTISKFLPSSSAMEKFHSQICRIDQ